MVDYWNALSDTEKVGNAIVLALLVMMGAWVLRRIFKG